MSSASEARTPLAPVDTGLRFVAGLIDLAVLSLVGFGLALGPLLLGGLALPMVGAVAAVRVCQGLPLSAFRRRWGCASYERGFAADAIEILREAKADGEEDATLYTYLGWALQETGDEAAALVELREALTRAPHLEQVQRDVETLTAKLEPAAAAADAPQDDQPPVFVANTGRLPGA